MMRRFISRIDRGLYPHYSDNWDNALFRELLLTALGPQSDVLDLGAGSGSAERRARPPPALPRLTGQFRGKNEISKRLPPRSFLCFYYEDPVDVMARPRPAATPPDRPDQF